MINNTETHLNCLRKSTCLQQAGMYLIFKYLGLPDCHLEAGRFPRCVGQASDL